MLNFGVIMAGGGGTRFWPLSREKLPKQFLNLTGNDLLINETIDRLSLLINKDFIYAVANKSHTATILDVTNGRLIPKHIISEPEARGTLACIAYAAISIFTEYGDGIMIATPSDAYIKDNSEFSKTLSVAVKAAESKNKIVTIGISPSFPSTGYGYIKYAESESEAKPVEHFAEKPDKSTAEVYIRNGYLWNSGIFVVKISVLLEKIKKYAPDVYKETEKIGLSIMRNDYNTVNEIYPSIRKTSFDRAIAEKAASCDEVIVVKGNFGWSDVGTWDMINTVHSPDENGNISVGDVLKINASDNVIFSEKKFCAVLGTENLVIVDTDDALLVCTKEKAQDVRLIVEKLKELNRKELI